MTTVQLRPAKDDDRSRIAEIWHTSASLPNVGPPIMPTLAELRNRVDQELAAGWQVTVAHVDHTIVGFVALKPRERVLAELFLWPDQIGAGVGKRLLDHAKAVIPAGFELYTTSENSHARRFYEREGLRAFREARHPGSGHPVTYYRWRGR